jgi:hypothetical protein
MRNELSVYYPEQAFRLQGFPSNATEDIMAISPDTTYLSLGAFRAADPRRDIEHEIDLGDWWLGADWHQPRFRAAWLPQTGELYVMQHEGIPGGGTVAVLATLPTQADVDVALAGWEDAVGEWGSVDWLAAHATPVTHAIAA